LICDIVENKEDNKSVIPQRTKKHQQCAFVIYDRCGKEDVTISEEYETEFVSDSKLILLIKEYFRNGKVFLISDISTKDEHNLDGRLWHNNNNNNISSYLEK